MTTENFGLLRPTQFFSAV